MAPEMLIPTREIGGGLQKLKIFAVIEDCVDEGEDKSNTRLFTDQQHAEIIRTLTRIWNITRYTTIV